MKILGIDTGTFETGWVIYDSVKHEVIEKGINGNQGFKDLIKDLDFDFAAIEGIQSYGMPMGQDTIDTVVWLGRYIECIESFGKQSKLLYKKRNINKTICNSNKAKDSNIRQAIIDMFPPSGGGKTPQIGTSKDQGLLYGIKSHMWAALAVSLTYCLEENLIERKFYSNYN